MLLLVIHENVTEYLHTVTSCYFIVLVLGFKSSKC